MSGVTRDGMDGPPGLLERGEVVRGRFSPAQRVLHWGMAACVLAMLFIGVAMVSTVRPINLTLVSIHRPLGIAILLLAFVRLGVRARRGRRPCRATCRRRSGSGPRCRTGRCMAR